MTTNTTDTFNDTMTEAEVEAYYYEVARVKGMRYTHTECSRCYAQVLNDDVVYGRCKPCASAVVKARRARPQKDITMYKRMTI